MSEERDELPLGVYELIKSDKTQALPIPAEAAWQEATVDVEDAQHLASLSRYIAQRISQRIEQAAPKERVRLVNTLLKVLSGDIGEDQIFSPTSSDKGQIVHLTELKRKGDNRVIPRPATPFSEVALLTNNPKEPNLGEEIQRELESADRVDLLCSFLKLTGVNVLKKQLDVLKQRGIPFRVITTTYMGATDRKAVDLLVEEYGAEVKVNYEHKSTRLHAKAWIFHRDSGFTTGYIGSSNLSHAALTEGLEWNVRVSHSVTPGILKQFEATFQSYWESRSFETYTASQSDKQKLDCILQDARIGPGSSQRAETTIDFSHVDVHPYPHQAVMLDELTSERERGHHRNLAVAATGTGKTILSALDYRRLRDAAGGRNLKILFIAHQEEILRQSRQAFATVMRDGNFGEFLFGGLTPLKEEHVFATVQTLSAGAMYTYAPDHFDVMVVDEFHHAEAKTYRKVIDYFRPQEFLGLTATPERTDGKNVASEFFDGRIATQLRLWDALEADLLVPFHYYAISDGTDLSSIKFQGGRYNEGELAQYYFANKQRVAIILQQIKEKVARPQQMRAIGFCVSIEHAQFMAEEFNKAGLPATYLTGKHGSADRRDAIRRLKNPDDELCTIFTVNLFNEGVDIPEVDTLLMLRPTQSATLFQQQLGRGLRRTTGKAVVVVLDFVGLQAKGFRFDLKLRAFTPDGRVTEATVRSPHAPPGSNISFDEKTQEQVLRSIKQAVNPRIDVLVDQVKVFAEEQKRERGFQVVKTDLLEPYLRRHGLELANIYGRKTSVDSGLTFTFLLDSAGQIPHIPELYEKGTRAHHISSRIKALSHVNDEERVNFYTRLLTEDIRESEMTLREKRMTWMLLYSFWPYGKYAKGKQHSKLTLSEGLSEIQRHPYFINELLQVWNYTLDVDRHAPMPVENLGGDIPLLSHGYYSREEIYAALGAHETKNASSPGSSVTGVLEAHATKTLALTVTLEKSEKQYTPKTMYQDYAITEKEFAWDSQNETRPDSRLGKIYRDHSRTGEVPLLFVRQKKKNAVGTEPYLFVGPVSYRSHVGSQPMHVTWELDRSLPADLYNIAKVAS